MASEKLFDDLSFGARTAQLSGTITLSSDQMDAIKIGRPVELLVTAVANKRSYTRRKDAVVELLTLVPIASEVQSVGTEIQAEPETAAGDND
jgi:hypothetical protein